MFSISEVDFCFFGSCNQENINYKYSVTSIQRTQLGPEKSVCYIEVSVINMFEIFNINFDPKHPIFTILVLFQLFMVT